MYLTNEWYYFTDAVDKETCNKITRIPKDTGRKWEVSSVDTQEGTSKEERLTGRKGDFKTESTIRTSDVCWVSEQWVYDIIFPLLKEANEKAGWQYHIKAAEPMQLTRYHEGGFYNLHRDGMGDHLSAYQNPKNAYVHGYVRKLSMSVMLNDNFDGGAFEFASYSKEKCIITPIEAQAGSVLVFPSGMEHRVAPVTKGLRYSLVVWFLGPPFV